MSSAANESAFAQPHWRVAAGGFKVAAWYEQDVGECDGGIHNPQPETLRATLALYRFGSSQRAADANVGGAWWFDTDALAQLKRFADQGGYRLQEAARLMLAIPESWSRIDQIITAFPSAPLRAWSGYGKVAQGGAGADRCTRYVPTQHVKVRQMYIPGLRADDPSALPGTAAQPLWRRVMANRLVRRL